MSETEVAERTITFVAESFLTEGSAPQPNDDLFALLDSLQILRLVVWIEEQFGFKVTDTELTSDNLSTPARIAAFVTNRVRVAEPQ